MEFVQAGALCTFLGDKQGPFLTAGRRGWEGAEFSGPGRRPQLEGGRSVLQLLRRPPPRCPQGAREHTASWRREALPSDHGGKS